MDEMIMNNEELITSLKEIKARLDNIEFQMGFVDIGNTMFHVMNSFGIGKDKFNQICSVFVRTSDDLQSGKYTDGEMKSKFDNSIRHIVENNSECPRFVVQGFYDDRRFTDVCEWYIKL